jgi:hypothetical protein
MLRGDLETQTIPEKLSFEKRVRQTVTNQTFTQGTGSTPVGSSKNFLWSRSLAAERGFFKTENGK